MALAKLHDSHRLFEIVRVAYRPTLTFGVLLDCGRELERDTAGEPFAVTGEEVWRNNLPRVSCIPTGEYLCRRRQSPRFGSTFEILDVPGRSLILFHAGNTAADTEGCVMVAESFDRLEGREAVTQSTKGFAELLARVAGLDEFRLNVRDA